MKSIFFALIPAQKTMLQNYQTDDFCTDYLLKNNVIKTMKSVFSALASCSKFCYETMKPAFFALDFHQKMLLQFYERLNRVF